MNIRHELNHEINNIICYKHVNWTYFVLAYAVIDVF